MSNYTVIDQKTEKTSFVVEKVTTTLTLVNLGNNKVGLSYESEFSGVKSGHVSGGPHEVNGNIDQTINDSPKVSLRISEFQFNGDNVSMHVQIVVDLPILGSVTIYDQILRGHSSAATGWSVALANVSAAREAQGKIA